MPDEQMYFEVVGSTSKVATELTTLQQRLLAIQGAFASAAQSAGLFNSSMKSGSGKDAVKMASSIRQIASAASRLSQAAPTLGSSLNSMVKGLNSMPAVKTKVVQSLTAISGSVKGLGSSLKNIVTYADRFGSSMTSMINAANGMPKLNKSAQKLLAQMSSLAPTATRATSATNKLGASMNQIGSHARRGGNGIFYLWGMAKRYLVTGFMIHAAAKIRYMFGSAIKKTMEWTETVNFFNVAYGSLAETAGEFYETLANTLGLDISSLASDAAVFTQMSKSLGFTNDEAYKLSRNLIMIGLDLASLTDKSFDESFEALRSGVLGGQYKPLATGYGINVQAAVLQETAEREGITKKVKNMTALEKAYLRYKTVLWSARIAQGDFTKTLDSPINQLRVFKSATEALSRAFGSIFIPVLGRVLPYVIAFVKCIQRAIAAVGIFAGYMGENWKNTTDIDMTGLNDEFSGIGEAAGGSSAAIAELKKNIMGFDQFNILKDNTKNGGGGGGGSPLGGSSFDFDWGDDWDMMFEQLQGNNISKIMEDITKAMKPLSDAFGNLWVAIEASLPSFQALWDNYLKPMGLWVIGTGLPAFVNWLADVARWVADHPKTVTDLLLLFAGIKAVSAISTIALTIKATLTGLGVLGGALTGGAAASVPLALSVPAITVAAITVLGSIIVGKGIVDYISETVFPNKPTVTNDGFESTSDMDYWDQAARNEDSFGQYTAIQTKEGSIILATDIHGLVDQATGGSIKMMSLIEAAEKAKLGGRLKGYSGTSSFGMPRDARETMIRKIYNEFDFAKNSILKSEALNKGNDGTGTSYAGQIKGKAKPVALETSTGGGQPLAASLKSPVKTSTVQLATMSAAKKTTSPTNLYDADIKTTQTAITDFAGKMQTTFNQIRSGLVTAVQRGTQEALMASQAFASQMQTTFNPIQSGLAMAARNGTQEAIGAYQSFSNRASEVFRTLVGNVRTSMIQVSNMMSLLPKTLSAPAITNAKNALVASKLTGIKMYASGGFPEDGLFMANHGELVGKFSNGKTAVANNVQIVEGIKYGVAEGISLAVSANGGSGGGNDYETTYRAVRDALKEMKIEATPMIVDGNTMGEVVINVINKKTRSNGASPLRAGA